MSDSYWLNISEDHSHPYTLVNSRRAKYIRIKMSSRGELSVVLPRGMAAKHAHSFIQSKVSWIAKNLSHITPCIDSEFPESINLALLNEIWEIEYFSHHAENLGSKIVEANNLLLQVTGDMEDWDSVKRGINHWCQKKAKDIFSYMLEDLAETHGFHFNKMTVRSQKTRWGSCSSNKNISLNSKLLLMPLNVVEYVMIHELCHTIEMNHSSHFWSLVKGCDADYLQNRRQLKQLGKLIVI